jgi:hypothetical protein
VAAARTPCHGNPGEPPGPDIAPAAELRIVPRTALSRLTAREQTVLVLRCFEDLPEADVARLLGISVGTVRPTAHRPPLAGPASSGRPRSHPRSRRARHTGSRRGRPGRGGADTRGGWLGRGWTSPVQTRDRPGGFSWCSVVVEVQVVNVVDADDLTTAEQPLEELTDMAAPWCDHPHHPANQARDGHQADPTIPDTRS